MKAIKKMWVVSLALMLVLGMTVLAAASTAPSISVNGTYVQLGAEPVVQNGTTLMPIRFVAEAMGANVEWNAQTSEATISNNYATVVLAIDSNNMTVTADGTTNTVNLDIAPQIINDRTFVAVNAIVEALGATVSATESTISISFAGDVVVPPAASAETPVEEAPAEIPAAPDTGNILDIVDFYTDLMTMQVEVSNALSFSTDFTNLMERMDALGEIADLIFATDYQSIESMRAKANGLADIAARFGINVDAFSHLL